jgi:UbiA prenyltransferase family
MNAPVMKRLTYDCGHTLATIRRTYKQQRSRLTSPEFAIVIRACLSTAKREPAPQEPRTNENVPSFSDKLQNSMKTGGNSWIDTSRWIPDKMRPYLHLARADKQVGTLLLLWPCFWSAALAAPIGSFPEILTMVKFATGAFVMRGAGCTINDLWDKDFDKHVERTKSEYIVYI